eukprot:1944664-Alexandrium_andersonii.AAC.1
MVGAISCLFQIVTYFLPRATSLTPNASSIPKYLPSLTQGKAETLDSACGADTCSKRCLLGDLRGRRW